MIEQTQFSWVQCPLLYLRCDITVANLQPDLSSTVGGSSQEYIAALLRMLHEPVCIRLAAADGRITAVIGCRDRIRVYLNMGSAWGASKG